MQNPALFIGRGTVAFKKISEDNRLGWLGKESSMASTDDTDSQDTAWLPPRAVALLLREKKKEKAAKIQTWMGKRKQVAGKL